MPKVLCFYGEIWVFVDFGEGDGEEIVQFAPPQPMLASNLNDLSLTLAMTAMTCGKRVDRMVMRPVYEDTWEKKAKEAGCLNSL